MSRFDGEEINRHLNNVWSDVVNRLEKGPSETYQTHKNTEKAWGNAAKPSVYSPQDSFLVELQKAVKSSSTTTTTK